MGSVFVALKDGGLLRVLRGEDLDSLTLELGATAATPSESRDTFLTAVQAGPNFKPADEPEDRAREFKTLIGERRNETDAP